MGFSLKRALGGALETFGGDLGNVVAGAIGVGSDQLAAEDQWKWQKKASDYKYQQDLNMWNLVNAYNDPSAQMERLQKARLNQNLVYGGGNVTGNTSSNGPEYSKSDVGYTDRGVQRRQLTMAMKEHQQRITNQAIENDLARQRLILSERDADRQDRLADAQIAAYKVGLGLTSARIGDIQFNQDHYTPPDRRGFFGKAIDDILGEGVRREVHDFVHFANEKARAEAKGYAEKRRKLFKHY